MTRRAEVRRKTRETEVNLTVDLDRPGTPEVATGIGFFDHMLSALATHGRFGLKVLARGDLHVDQHHLVEDVGIALGSALREALDSDLRIRRFAHAYAPLDDALARAVVDVSGRGYLQYSAEFRRARVGGFEVDLAREFFFALAANARINLHLAVLHGRNAHHQLEALFKALALALRDALALDSSLAEVPSTKGALSEAQARPGKIARARRGSRPVKRIRTRPGTRPARRPPKRPGRTRRRP
jgi:imidazoleglycerol-phosphate dehydratase